MNAPTSRDASLDALRSLSILAVLYIHSPDPMEGVQVGLWIKRFICAGAVPLFFVLSGYFSGSKLHAGLASRALWRGLLLGLIVPYLTFNVATIAAVLILKACGLAYLLSGGGAYFTVELEAQSMLNALVGLDGMPIMYQFWFLRDLIVVQALAILGRKFLHYGLFLAPVMILLPYQVAPSAGFFMLGYALSQGQILSRPVGAHAARVFVLAWPAVGLFQVAEILRLPGAAIGAGGALWLFLVVKSALNERLTLLLAALAPATFFIYACHEPLLTAIVRIWSVAGLPGVGSLTLFLVIPPALFGALAGCYWVVRAHFPGLLRLLTGGR